MTASTMPRPPVPDVSWVANEDAAAAGIDWRAVGIVVLTAVPIAIAWSIGMAVRVIALIAAAVVEGYYAGRGYRPEPEPEAEPPRRQPTVAT
jgi:hypothetical protein